MAVGSWHSAVSRKRVQNSTRKCTAGSANTSLTSCTGFSLNSVMCRSVREMFISNHAQALPHKRRGVGFSKQWGGAPPVGRHPQHLTDQHTGAGSAQEAPTHRLTNTRENIRGKILHKHTHKHMTENKGGCQTHVLTRVWPGPGFVYKRGGDFGQDPPTQLLTHPDPPPLIILWGAFFVN